MTIKKIMPKIFSLLLLICFMYLAGCELSSNANNNPNDAEYSVKYVDTYNGEGTIYKYKQDTLSRFELPIFEKEGYNLKGFSYTSNGSLINEDEIINLKETKVIYIIWEEIVINPFVIQDIGRVEITVNAPITSKKEYVASKITIKGHDYNLENAKSKIRLRGNSSLSAPKKSYKIKFDEKQNVFGFGKDKEWALIANYYDPSLVRNYYAYKLAKLLGMEYTVDCEFVEVYLNGEYEGLYLFCETVKTGSNRVDIEPDDETIVDLPFLLELDQKMISEGDPDSNGVKDVDYFELNLWDYAGKMYPVGTKYPDAFDEITIEQYESIKKRVYDAFKSVKNGTYDQYFDVNSLVDFYLMQELMMNIDLDHSSVFFYQAVGEKIKMGPVWDFDISSGNCNYVYNYSPNTLMKSVNGGAYLYNELMVYRSFRDLFIDRLNSISTIIGTFFYDSFEENYRILKDCMERDNERWDALNKEYWPKPYYLIGLTHYEQMMYFRDYIVEHFAYMLRTIK